jgi:hypothetical protein
MVREKLYGRVVNLKNIQHHFGVSDKNCPEPKPEYQFTS